MIKKIGLIMATVVSLMLSGLVFAEPVSIKGQYETLSTPMMPVHTEDEGNPVEVIEFFSYTCPHCENLEPAIKDLIKTFKDNPNVRVERVPVGFNPVFFVFQKLYYTVEALERPDLHDVIFNAIIQERQRLDQPAVLKRFIVSQGLDWEEFSAVFNSFGIEAIARRASQLSDDYRVEGTPVLYVAGKYMVNGETAGTNIHAVEVAKALVEKELIDRDLK